MGDIQIKKSAEKYDAVIVGSGAGGGMAGYVLANAGVKVLMLEAGPYFDPAKDYTRLSDSSSAFNQYSGLIAQHFYKTALDIEKCQVIAFIFQHFYPSGCQCAYQRSVFIKHFKLTGYTRQLNAIHFTTEQLFFRS